MYGKLKKSNKASAFSMVLLIMMFMSVLGITMITLTMNEFRLSIFYTGLDKAYFAAEAGVEQVAKTLDARVAKLQETARRQALSAVQTYLASMNIAQDEPMDQNEVDEYFRERYDFFFRSGLISAFADAGSQDGREALMGLDPETSEAAEISISADTAAALDEVIYDGANDPTNLSVTVTGKYARSRVEGEEPYRKKIKASFNLLPQPAEEHYGIVPVSKAEVPELLGKAVLTEKNMLSAGGNVTIGGDVLAFGTIPASNGKEDMDKDWQYYGGIIAGMCQSYVNIENTEGVFGFDTSYLNGINDRRGAFTISGDAATMGYIMTLYGKSTEYSAITVNGSAFARSARLALPANYARMTYHDLYTTDNLQLDSNRGQIDVLGNYYGFIDSGYALEKYSTGGDWQQKRTSSVVVNGTSTLNFNGELYIGGNTFLSDYIDMDTGHRFMSGLAAAKSTSKLGYAFLINNKVTGAPNTLYWYEHSIINQLTGASIAQIIYKSGTKDIPMMAGKKAPEENPAEGSERQLEIERSFSMPLRGIHFKNVWDREWKGDMALKSYVSTDSIRLGPNSVGGIVREVGDQNGNGVPDELLVTIKGYANGAFAGTVDVPGSGETGIVAGPHDFSHSLEPSVFADVQRLCFEKFYKAIRELITGTYSSSDPATPSIDFVSPGRTIDDSRVDNSFVDDTDPDMLHDGVPHINDKGFVYYSDRDMKLSPGSPGQLVITDLGAPGSPAFTVADKGIIYTKGNIYVDAGVKLTGTIVTKGNVLFLGNADITYDLKTVRDILNSDNAASGFFRYRKFVYPEGGLKSTRLKVKNIEMTDYKEI